MEERANLDLSVAQALFAARLLETAANHPGPWSFRWGEIEIPAEKVVSEVGVSFVGRFPDVCYLTRPEGSLLLLCEGTVLGMRAPEECEHPGDTAFVVTWEVLATHPKVSNDG